MKFPELDISKFFHSKLSFEGEIQKNDIVNYCKKRIEEKQYEIKEFEKIIKNLEEVK
jgi:hypothetical protein